MKRRTLLASLACGLGWSLTVATFAQIDPQRCIEGQECCTVAPCCEATAGPCTGGGTCTCSASCGPQGGSCSCRCDPGQEYSPKNRFDNDAGLPPVPPDASFSVNYDRGTVSLDEVVRTIRAASRWTIDVPFEVAAVPVNGKWNGTFVEVIEQIAKETGVGVAIDVDQRRVVFGLNR